MTVLLRHKFCVAALLLATAASSPAHAVSNGKPAAANYWRGGYFGPAFSLYKLKNTYNPMLPVGVQKLKANGKLIGMVGGYNFLSKNFMWGIEGDIAGGAVFNDDLSYIATARGRIGKPFNYTLPYLTAGLAIAGLKKPTAGAPFKVSGRVSGTQPGFVVGAGIEQVLANAISGRLEYTYGRFLSGGSQASLKNIHMFRASIAIHFRD